MNSWQWGGGNQLLDPQDVVLKLSACLKIENVFRIFSFSRINTNNLSQKRPPGVKVRTPLVHTPWYLWWQICPRTHHPSVLSWSTQLCIGFSLRGRNYHVNNGHTMFCVVYVVCLCLSMLTFHLSCVFLQKWLQRMSHQRYISPHKCSAICLSSLPCPTLLWSRTRVIVQKTRICKR